MQIRKTHKLGKAAAIQRIDHFLEGLLRRPMPAGVHVKHPSKSWSNGVMSFSARLSKGFLGTTIQGEVEVTDDEVILDAEVPAMVRTFVGEDKIRHVIEQQIDALLGG
jgi:hypothetical protein